MIEELVKKLVDEFIVNKMISVDQKEEYEYAMICQVETFITIGSIIIISIFTNNLFPTLFFLG